MDTIIVTHLKKHGVEFTTRFMETLSVDNPNRLIVCGRKFFVECRTSGRNPVIRYMILGSKALVSVKRDDWRKNFLMEANRGSL
jgi:hypothetical protein